MAPKTLLTKLKFKPVKKIDPNEEPVLDAPETDMSAYVAPPVVLPPVTDAERRCWAEARALQFSDENGQPVEGWAKRIATMEADGRLFRVGNVLHRREA